MKLTTIVGISISALIVFGIITNYEVYGDKEKFDYPPHIHNEIEISINSNEKTILDLKNKDATNFVSYVGDVVNITISVSDDYGIESVSDVKLITNFAKKPSNMNKYYAVHNDNIGQVGLSIYEWYSNKSDVKYDYGGTLSWNDSTIVKRERVLTTHDYVGPIPFNEKELLITYSFTTKDILEKNQFIVKIKDKANQEIKVILPFTLEVLPQKENTISKETMNEIIVDEIIEDKTTDNDNEIPKIIMNSDHPNYHHGQKIIITGNIEKYHLDSMKEKDIAYQIKSPKNEILLVGNIYPESDGTFSFSTFAMDTQWKYDGDYVFYAKISSIEGNIIISYDNTQVNNTELIIEDKVIEDKVIEDKVIEDKVIEDKVIEDKVIEDKVTHKINCGPGTESVNGICQVIQTAEPEEKEGGGCLIATAAYGSEFAPQVQMLREIRDNQLMNTESGSAFMSSFNDLYYTFSPTIADMERESPMFKEAVKLGLTPMLSTLSLMENAETESEVLGLGLSVIALNLGMYLGVPATIIIGIKKRN